MVLTRMTTTGLAACCTALSLFTLQSTELRGEVLSPQDQESAETAAQAPAEPVEGAATVEGTPADDMTEAAEAVAPVVIENPVPLQEFKIGVSDTLNISVWKNKELSARVPVAPDGMISLPLVGDVLAAGRTPAEVRAELKERYAGFLTAPEVSLVVTAINSRVFYIIGEVAKQGVQELLLPTTILQGLARAGGLSNYAKKDNIVVLRRVNDVEQFITISIKGIEKGKSLEENILLKPGDTIIVP